MALCNGFVQEARVLARYEPKLATAAQQQQGRYSTKIQKVQHGFPKRLGLLKTKGLTWYSDVEVERSKLI